MGLARQWEYSINSSSCNAATDYSEEIISDQLVRGIADEDLLDTLIGDKKTDKTLQEMVAFIARKKQGKTEHGTVSYEHTNTSAVNQSKSPASQARTPTFFFL